MAPKHPAPFSAALIPEMAQLLEKYLEPITLSPLVLDPFAGVGGIHKLRDFGYTTIGVELEPEWAEQSAFSMKDPTKPAVSKDMVTVNYTRVGNALDLEFYDDSFDAVVTSPCYGNRMADHHEARDGSHRRTYKHYLGRDLSLDSAGGLQWGDQYRDFHSKVWNEVRRVLAPNGVFILNIKDHQRAKRREHVSNWHYKCCCELGFQLVDVVRVDTPSYRYGQNREVRYPERLLVFRNVKARDAVSKNFSRPNDTSMNFDDEGFPIAEDEDAA